MLFSRERPKHQTPGTTSPAAMISPCPGTDFENAMPLIVRVEVPLVIVEFKVTEFGNIVQVILVVFAGRAQARLTAPVNPPVPLTVTVEVPLPLTATISAKGLALMPKTGDEHVTTVLPEIVPTVAVMVLVPVA